MSEAPDGRTRRTVPPLPLGRTIRDVFALYREHWLPLTLVALVVLIPQALATAAFGDYEVDHVSSFGDVAKLAGLPLSVAINLGGEALYSGLVAAVVVNWRSQAGLPDLWRVAKALPLGALIVADLLIAAGTALGLVLLIVPGIAFATYTFVGPALMELRGVGVRDGLRESVRLVRGNAWRVLLVGLLFYQLTEAVSALFSDPFHSFAEGAVAHLAAEAVMSPLQGAATVILALSLIELHGEKAPEPRH